MDKDCSTCRKLHCKASHPKNQDNAPNKEITYFYCYCTENRNEYIQLIETKDENNFYCPNYEQGYTQEV